MPNGITRETFDAMDTNSKLGVLFDYLSSYHAACAPQRAECDARFHKIEKRKLVDTGVSGVTGLVGGFFAVVVRRFFG